MTTTRNAKADSERISFPLRSKNDPGRPRALRVGAGVCFVVFAAWAGLSAYNLSLAMGEAMWWFMTWLTLALAWTAYGVLRNSIPRRPSSNGLLAIGVASGIFAVAFMASFGEKPHVIVALVAGVFGAITL